MSVQKVSTLPAHGNYRPEHVCALQQSLELSDAYQEKLRGCDAKIEEALRLLTESHPITPEHRPEARPARRAHPQKNEPRFDIRSALQALLGVDLTQIHGLGPYAALKLVAECGHDMSRRPTAKHFTSWLTLSTT
jgi:transposase